MNSTDFRVENTGAVLKPLAFVISFGQQWNAPKNFFVKSGQPLPIPGNKVGMNKFGVDGHRNFPYGMNNLIQCQYTFGLE